MIPREKMVGNRTTLWSLALIAISVVLIRWVVFLVDTTQAHIAYDVDCYLEIARNVVSGKGYSLANYTEEPAATAMRGPTVVYFFVGVLWLFGDHPWSIVIAQWLVDVGTSIILFFITMEIFHDRRIAFVTGLLFAFYEPGLIFTFRGWSEPMFTLVLAGFSLSLLRALRQPSIWRYVVCGFLLGITVLARPVMQFYPLLILPLLWWALDRNWRQIVPRFAIFSLAFAAVLSPWVIRNYFVFNAFVPGSTHNGAPFYENNFALDQPDYLRHRGTEESVAPLWKALEARFGPAPSHIQQLDFVGYAQFRGFNELDINRFAFQEGMTMVQTYPGRYFLKSIVRFLCVWFHHRFVTYLMVGGQLPRAWLVAAFNGVLLGLAVLAFAWFRVPWRRPTVVSLLALVAYNSTIYAATQGVGRYSVPIVPYVMVFAAFSLVHLLPNRARVLTRIVNVSRITTQEQSQ
jgi:4-amino-4-deoxy-L-arabinose transferase-like glycosyltransferase